MATTKKQPAKKAVVKKQSAKKSPAKKVAAKKAATKKDEKGKKLAELTFTVYEKGTDVNGEANLRDMMRVHQTLIHMIADARMEGLK